MSPPPLSQVRITAGVPVLPLKYVYSRRLPCSVVKSLSSRKHTRHCFSFRFWVFPGSGVHTTSLVFGIM